MPNTYDVIEAAGPAYVPARFGLLSVAARPTTPSRWLMGMQRVGLPCGPAESIELLPCPVAPSGGPSHEGPVSWAATPFWVYAFTPCSPVGQGDDLADLHRRTEAALTNGAPRAVERVFWTGHPSQNPSATVYPHLQADAQVDADFAQGAHQVVLQSAADEVTSTPEDAVDAIGLLEEGLADCWGGEGVIHVTRRALAELDHLGIVHREGQQLRTLGGNLVAVYSPTEAGGGPDGGAPASGSPWFYATPPVEVYEGPVREFGLVDPEFAAAVLDRNVNTAIYLLGRPYAAWYDGCCLLAAEVVLEGASP